MSEVYSLDGRKPTGTLEGVMMAQRDRLKDYLALSVLEEQAIRRGRAEVLEGYAELDRSLAAEIQDLERVRRELQRTVAAGTADTAELERELQRWRGLVLQANARNRDLLTRSMRKTGQQLRGLRRRIRTRSPFSRDHAPCFLDIQT